ncbi:condensation domain-containing protein, partial [Dyella mobilis]|uniref:condensation domain-containing protein n=1 Tax=Dyella mobilis TaxID=1849582 RepID=UPI0024E069CD
AAWQRSLDALFARHEALRTVFVAHHGEPSIRLLPPELCVPLHLHDLRGVPEAHALLTQLTADEAQAPFDLVHGPLIRARLIHLAEHDHVFLLTQHHIVSDGWSLGVLIGELNALYRAFVAGQDTPLAPLTIQYPDYAAWQRQWLTGERVQAHGAYWRQQLADAPVLL